MIVNCIKCIITYKIWRVMGTFKLNYQLLLKSFLLALAVLFTFTACSENPSDSYDSDEMMELGVDTENSPMVNSNADFPVFHQVFNHDTHPWATKMDGGETGWCGSIEHKDRRSNGDISPVVGRGYATIMHGECNEFWDARLPGLTSAPATTLEPGLLSTKFPESGYVQQLDIYLDPEYDTGNEGFTFLDVAEIDGENVVFSFANTVGNQNQNILEAEFAYFTTLVLKDEHGNLNIGDFQVDEAGWHTFRHVFGSEDGSLTVDFELLQNGQLLYTESIDTSLLGVPTSSLDTHELGSAYLWFSTIADGVELPIDQHRLRPGK